MQRKSLKTSSRNLSFTAVNVLIIFAMIMGVVLIVANFLAAKVWSLCGIPVDAGVLLFPVSYIVGDLLVEFYGRKLADLVAVVSSAMGLLTMIFLFLANLLPDYPNIDNSAFSAMYGMTGRIFLASLVGFLAGQVINNLVFVKIRQLEKGNNFALRALGSSVVAHLIDSLIFETIAFVGRLPFSEFVLQFGFAFVLALALESLLLPLTNYCAKRLRVFLELKDDESFAYEN